MAQLVRAELVFRRGTPPDAEYTFKHALVQDAAYSTLLRGRRQQLHASIVPVLEEQFPEIAAKHSPSLLPTMCAWRVLLKRDRLSAPGRASAMARSAMIEAVAQLAQGLELFADLPAGDERDHLELDVQVALGAAIAATKGFAALEVGRPMNVPVSCAGSGPMDPELHRRSVRGCTSYHLHRSGDPCRLRRCGGASCASQNSGETQLH